MSPSPALITRASILLAKLASSGAAVSHNHFISTFIAKIFLTVSISVSPLETDEPELEKLTTSADSLFSANSNDRRVLVLFSKKILAMVMSRSEGTFDRPVDNVFKIISGIKDEFYVIGGKLLDAD